MEVMIAEAKLAIEPGWTGQPAKMEKRLTAAPDSAKSPTDTIEQQATDTDWRHRRRCSGGQPRVCVVVGFRAEEARGGEGGRAVNVIVRRRLASRSEGKPRVCSRRNLGTTDQLRMWDAR
ncbi:unnamed protein product [Prorocentrum cordatum]|uniref:Uncharacterized protein n=1 Tax=Prorocentrum cordatum TaxID=2364126 RepID=A0ABN9SYB7_9DINO|nr:unnamed protein product [Polarella glacialis]